MGTGNARKEIYKLDHLSFSFDREPILEDVNMTLYAGDFVGIVGANGGGKTTLLRLLTGELKADSGRIEFMGEEGFSSSRLRHIGYVPQIHPASQLSFPISAEEMVALDLYADRLPRFFLTAKDKKKVAFSLRHLGVDHLAHANFHHLSGGQKQRVLIAKALVNDPEVLIFDEPTVGIDYENKQQFYRILDHMNWVHHITIILVTHERPQEGLHWTRVFSLSDHHLEELCLNTPS